MVFQASACSLELGQRGRLSVWSQPRNMLWVAPQPDHLGSGPVCRDRERLEYSWMMGGEAG